MKLPFSILFAMPLLLPWSPPAGGASGAAPVTRAATPTLALPLGTDERAELALAEQVSQHELTDLRGGDLTNDDLWTVLLVLGIVVLVLILI